MSSVALRWWLLAATVLAIASAAALALLPATSDIPSVVRNLLYDFARPGVTVWWLVLGGPFRSIPYSPSGIGFAAAANAALWLLAIWFVAVLVRAVRRMLAAAPE